MNEQNTQCATPGNRAHFDFEGRALDIVYIEDELWFIAKQACDILELQNSRQAVSRLDDDEKKLTDDFSCIPSIHEKGPNRQHQLVSESGLYNLIFTSKKPVAKRFRKWVTSEVLPQIRKTGNYISNPDDAQQALEAQQLALEGVRLQSRSIASLENAVGRLQEETERMQTQIAQQLSISAYAGRSERPQAVIDYARYLIGDGYFSPNCRLTIPKRRELILIHLFENTTTPKEWSYCTDEELLSRSTLAFIWNEYKSQFSLGQGLI